MIQKLKTYFSNPKVKAKIVDYASFAGFVITDSCLFGMLFYCHFWLYRVAAAIALLTVTLDYYYAGDKEDDKKES